MIYTNQYSRNSLVKKYLFFVVLLAVFIIFQSTYYYTHVNIRGATPDFILVVISTAAFVMGPVAGEILGFATGLTLDILSGGLLGLCAFTYTLIGYGVGGVGEKIYASNAVISIIILFTATLTKAAFFSMLAALFLEPGYFSYFVEGRAFLEAVMNSLVALPFFVFITRLAGRVSG